MSEDSYESSACNQSVTKSKHSAQISSGGWNDTFFIENQSENTQVTNKVESKQDIEIIRIEENLDSK